MRILVATLAVLSACGPGGRNGDDGPADPDAGIVESDATTQPTDNSRVYGHSGTALYRLNPLTLSAVSIGAMTGLEGQLLDLAVDKNDKLVGSTATKFYSLDANTGKPTLLADFSGSAGGLTSLSYVPSNISDPASPEVLVTANGDGDVFRIDVSGNSATATKIGNYGKRGADQIKSSGDLFGVRGFGIYATVDIGSGSNDWLAKIDPATWKATPLPNDTGYDKIFGLGFWGGRIYGFVDDGFEAGTGKIIQIDPVTGKGTLLVSGAERWFGAGVTTDAPTIF